MDILEIASKLARTMYTNKFCSNCGRAIAIDEAKSLLSDENGENTLVIHKNCSLQKTAKKTLTYQINQA